METHRNEKTNRKGETELAPTITPEQRTALDNLRVIGLARYAAMKAAEQAYKGALEREQEAYRYAAEHGEFFTEDGARVTGEKNAFLMSPSKFQSEMCPLIAQGYKELYGLDYPVGYTPVFEQFLKPLNDARKACRLTGAEYMRILGDAENAEKIERAVKSYCHPKYMEVLDAIVCGFLGVCNVT